MGIDEVETAAATAAAVEPERRWRARWQEASSFARTFATPRARDLLLSGATMLLAALVFRVLDDESLHHGLDYDETYFVWGGWSITKGLVPYRDFIEFKPPIAFLTHALAVALYGFGAFQYRWFFLWFPMTSLVALHGALLSRRIGRLPALALVLAIAHLWVNPRFHDAALSDTESIGLAYYFFAVACLVAKTERPGWLRAAGGGFLLACTLSKEPFLLSVLVTWVAAFLLERDPRQHIKVDAVRYLRRTGIGAGVVAFALILYMLPTGALGAYVQMARGYFRLHHDPAQSYCVVLGRFHPTTPLNDLLMQVGQARRQLLNFEVLGYLLPFGVAFAVFVPRRSPLLAATAGAAFAAGLWGVTASNCNWKHYYNMAFGGLFLALLLGLDAMEPTLTHPAVRRYVGWALLASVLVVLGPRLDTELTRFGTRTFADPYREPVPGAFEAIARYTTPADRIFTSGMPSLYVQTNRRSAVRESAIIDEALGFYEGATDEQKLAGLRAELEQNRPKIVIMDPLYASRLVRTNRALLSPFLAAHGYTKLSEHIWLRPS